MAHSDRTQISRGVRIAPYPHRQAAGGRPRGVRAVAAGNARQRGSTILLVVTALVLALLLGLSYMNTAREDREAIRISSINKDVDQVEQSILDHIGNVLREDVGPGDPVLDQGGFFNDRWADNAFDRPPFLGQWVPAFGEFVSPRPRLDYAGPLHWMDHRDFRGQPIQGMSHSPWLASTEPIVYELRGPMVEEDTNDEFDVGGAPIREWAQITRLTAGGFVDEFGEVADDPGNRDYDQHWWAAPSMDGNQFGANADFRRLVPDPNFPDAPSADATGDGIMDSRWEQAPLFSLGGIDYFMAVRITDNSALLNLNTAFSQLAPNRSYASAGQTPRWEYPTELDLGSLVHRYGILGAYELHQQESGIDLLQELDEFLDWRSGPSEDWPRGDPVDFMRESWRDDIYGNLRGLGRLGLDTEWALRYRGGLNNPRLTSRIGSQDGGLKHILRAYDQWETEAMGDDFGYHREQAWWQGLENIIFEMGPEFEPRYDRSDVDPVVDYYEMNPRSKLTTVSGEREQGKRDLRYILDTIYGGGNGGRTEMRRLIRDVVNVWSTPDPANQDQALYHETSVPGGFTNGGGQVDPPARVLTFATTYALNLFAYGHSAAMQPVPSPSESEAARRMPWLELDQDLAEELLNFDGVQNFDMAGTYGSDHVRFYGHIPLPFITEVYSQGKYFAREIEEDTDTGEPEAIIWERLGDSGGFVVEIRNPHPRTLWLDNVRLEVGGEDWGRLSDLVEGDPFLLADEAIYLYRHSGEGPPGNGEDEEDWEPEEAEDRMNPDEFFADAFEGESYRVVDLMDGPASELDIADEPEYHWPDIAGAVGAESTFDIRLMVRIQDNPRLRPDGESSANARDRALTAEEIVTIQHADGESYWMPYQVILDRAVGHPLERRDEVNITDPMLVEEGDIDWEQFALLGNGQGLQMMTLVSGDWGLEALRLGPAFADGEYYQTRNIDLPHIGVKDKGIEGRIQIDEGAVEERQQFVFPATNERLRSIGELALVTTFAPGWGDTQEERSYGGQWEMTGAERVEDFMLDLGHERWLHDQDTTFDETEHTPLHWQARVPHAYVLMDRFHLNRRHNGSGGSFVPGKININTATRETLLSALPVPWDENATTAEIEQRERTRRRIVDAILAYRDNQVLDPGAPIVEWPRPFSFFDDWDNPDPDVMWLPPEDRNADPWRQERGIRYIGEIYAATWHLFVDGGPDVASYENAGVDAYEINGVRIDHLSNPRPDQPDNIIDDVEEMTLVLRMLSQMLTTRSDVYTAHILIRGYAFDDFEREDPVVERRLMGVFDRSPVLGGGSGTPRLLGVYRY